MRTKLLAFALSIVSCCTASLVVAQTTIYDAIPADALGFLVLQNLDDLDGKLGDLAGHMRLPIQMAHPVHVVKAAMGFSVAVEDKGSVGVALLASAARPSQPGMVILVPVTDYEQFITALNGNAKLDATDVLIAGQLMRVAKKGKFAAMATQDHREALEQLVSAKTGSAESIASMKEWLAARDVAVVVRTDGVKQLFGEIRKGLDSTINAFPANAPQADAVRTVFKAYDTVLKTLQDECKTFAVGLNVDGSGAWHITTQTKITSSGTIATGLKSVQPIEGGALAGLPDGPFVFAFGGAMPAALRGSFRDITAAAFKGNPAYKGLSEEDLKILLDSQTAMTTDITGMNGLLGVAPAKQPLYSSFVGTLHVKDSRKFLANYREKSEAMRDAFKGKNVPGVISDIKSFKIGEVDALEAVTDVSVAAVGGPPQMKEMMEMMFGPGDKVSIFLAAADSDTVVMSYINKNGITRGLSAMRSSDASLAGSSLVAQTQPLLPASAQWEAYLSPAGAMQWIQQILTASLPAQIRPNIPPMGESPPIGLAVKVTENVIESDLVLPSATIDSIGAFVEKLRAGP